MADEQNQEETSGGKKNIILFSMVLLVAVGVSVGGTMFFLGSSSDQATAPVAAAAVADNRQQNAIYHNMRPAYIINYVTGAKPRFLQAEFTVMARNEAAIEAVILHMPLIRSEIVNFLTEQNFLELQTQEGKELVRQGIVVLVNNILESYQISPGIESALITNFVLQ